MVTVSPERSGLVWDVKTQTDSVKTLTPHQHSQNDRVKTLPRETNNNNIIIIKIISESWHRGIWQNKWRKIPWWRMLTSDRLWRKCQREESGMLMTATLVSDCHVEVLPAFCPAFPNQPRLRSQLFFFFYSTRPASGLPAPPLFFCSSPSGKAENI